MKLVALISLTMCVALAGAPRIHKFDDGFVERTVAVVVRDRTAHVEYSIGLNQATVKELLTQWQKVIPDAKDIPSASKQPNQQQSNHQENEPSPRTVSDATSNSKNAKPGPAGSMTQDRKIETAKDPFLTSRRSVTSKAKQGSSKSDSATESEGHAIDPELLAKFKQLAPIFVAQGLVVTCNGERVPVVSISEGPAPRHPFTVSFQIQVRLPETKTIDLKIHDGNFGVQTGAARYAIKAAGDAMLLRSDAAPIIIRAERAELMQLSKTDRIEKTTINARLGFSNRPK